MKSFNIKAFKLLTLFFIYLVNFEIFANTKNINNKAVNLAQNQTSFSNSPAPIKNIATSNPEFTASNSANVLATPNTKVNKNTPKKQETNALATPDVETNTSSTNSNVLDTQKTISIQSELPNTSEMSTAKSLASVNTQTTSNYNNQTNPTIDFFKNKTVAVLEFKEGESVKISTSISIHSTNGINTTAQSNHQQTYYSYNDIKKFFTERLVEEIKNNGIFKNIASSNLIGYSDYYITGTIISIDLDGNPSNDTNISPKTNINPQYSSLFYKLKIDLSLIDSKTHKPIYTKRFDSKNYDDNPKLSYRYNMTPDIYVRLIFGFIANEFVNDIATLHNNSTK